MTGKDEVWTIGRILTWTTSHFAEKRIDAPRLDAELLLAAVLEKNRVYLYTHYDQPLTPAERDAYRAFVVRRAKHEPVAYILGEREFYGRPFLVTRDVLIPRPETEHLIDAVREWGEAHAPAKVADIGTGSGIIAVSLAAQFPAAEVVAVDISEAALAVARQNAERHGVAARVSFVLGDLLGPLAGRGSFDVIAANPPYVAARDRAALMADVRDHEPAVALFGGEDGMTVLTRLCREAPALLARPGLLALEMGAGQWPAVRALLEESGVFARVRAVADLAGHPRVALGEL